MKKMVIAACLAVVFGLAVIGGCLNGAGIEWGHVPSGTFADPEGLPAFGSQLLDGWGILYTLKAGSFDPDHRSGCARKTYGAYQKAYAVLMKGGKEFSMSAEGSTDKVEFTYPANWNQILWPEKKEIALQVAEYVAYNSMVWHEMLTWKDARLFLGLSDFESAFSWEDIFCDLYGAKVAIQSIKMGGNFERNVTDLTWKQLQEWQVVSMQRAIEIADSVEGSWWKRELISFHSNILMRNMDIGCDDGWVTASLIPGYYDGEPVSLEAPKLDLLDKYGVKMKYTITSMHSQGGELRRLVGIKGPAVEPQKDFCKIMHQIQKEAVEKYRFKIAK
ncbi:MAG: DUF4056 domain-containing protein [Nanoarchaeota archaeon]|nr:DUF4056 domain-containing protein [Nanoarchaeota archaeon]